MFVRLCDKNKSDTDEQHLRRTYHGSDGDIQHDPGAEAVQQVERHGEILLAGRVKDKYFWNSIEADIGVVHQRKKSVDIVEFR